MTPEDYYFSVPKKTYKIDDSSIALRVFGQGSSLIFIHGFHAIVTKYYKI